jgi:hypothetical protein
MAGKPGKAKEIEIGKGIIKIPTADGELTIKTSDVLGIRKAKLDRWGSFPRVGIGANCEAILIIRKKVEEC